MSFEAPLQLAWLALLIPVVLLYLRYAGRKTADASTLAIWKHALAQRTLWSRWRRTVSILAACVPVVLVALALARPEFTVAKTAPRTIVVVIDNTASMNATDVRPSRLAKAKQEAHRLIGRLRTHETMAILSTDSFTHAHCGLTDDRRVLQAALGQVQPTDGAGDLSLAIATAERVLSGQPNPVLVVLSDKVDDSLRESSFRENVVLKQFAAEGNNVAITRLASRPTPADGSAAHEVLVEVANFGDTPSDVAVDLGFAGAPAQKLQLNVPADGRVQRVATIAVDKPGLLTVQLTADDALLADNEATLLISPADKLRVGFDDVEAGLPLAAALASAAGVEVVAAGGAKEADVVVLGSKSTEKLSPQPMLVIAPQANSDLWQVAGELEAPQAATQIDHPLVAGVDLRRVAIDRAVKLKFKDDAQVLAATAAGDPLLAIVPRDTGDVVVLAFSPTGSDLALRGDFPRLVANALHVLSNSRSDAGLAWATDDIFVEAYAPAGTRLTSPFGDTAMGNPLAVALVHAGVWNLESPAGDAALPVNLNNARESDLRPSPASDLPTRVPSPLLPDIGPLWRWFVGLAVVWVLGQWVFYQRRDVD